MKQFRFWAIVFSLSKLLLYAGAITIIFLLIAINTNTLHQFVYLCAGMAIALVLVIFLLVKRVVLTLGEDNIEIKISGQEEFQFAPDDFHYVRGANINLPQSQGELNMVFEGKIITFSIFDMRNMLGETESKHIEILSALIDIYNLENQGRDKKNLSKMFVYRNVKKEDERVS